jgi:hypothetical protein
MGFNESVLFRVEADASGVQRGARQAESALQRLQGKYKTLAADAQAAGQRTTFYTTALRNVNSELAVLQVRQAKAAASAEALWLAQRRVNMGMGNARDRALVSAAVQTSAQRAIERMRAAERVASVANLSKNVVGAAEGTMGGHGGHGHGRSGIMRESMVLVREISAGNWKRAAGSASLLLQYLGKLGTVMSLLINPITGVIGGLAAGVGLVYKIGLNAANIIRQSRDVGFSTTGYQTVLRQAGRESGGKQAAESALGHLSELTGQARSGDMGAYKKFQRFGVQLSSASGAAYSNEQIYGQLLQKLEGTSDPAKRAAMAMEFFGESYKKFLKTLDEGKTGFDDAMGGAKRHVQSAGQLSVWQALADTVGNTASGAWNGVKGAGAAVWNAMKTGYTKYSELVNPNLRRLDQGTMQGAAIDERIRELEQSGKIKVRGRGESSLETSDPELAVELKTTRSHVQDLNNEMADRGKESLDTLADKGRKMTGLQHRRNYTLTPRMKTALKIQDLEEQSTMAWERGDDATFTKLRKQAGDMRAVNPWLKAMDRNPMQKTEEQLVVANKALADVQAMAKMVLSESHAGG